MRQTVVAVLLMLLLVFALGMGASSVGAAKERVVFWYWGSDHDFDVLERVTAEFEELNPDIDIEIQRTSYGAGKWEKWVIAAAAGTLPDASMANWGIFGRLAEVLEPLEGYVRRSSELSREEFFPAHWDSQWREGHMLGLPFRCNSQVILYNKQIFAEAGIADIPRTWDELAQYAARLTKRSDDAVERWGFSFRNYHLNRTVNHFAQRNGWQPFDPKYTKAYYTDPKLIQTIEFLNDMVQREIAAIRGMPGCGSLGNGRVAMQNDGPWILSGIRSSNPDLEIGAFAPPVGPSGEQPYANLGGENLVMFKTSKNKEATFKYLTHLAYTANSEYNWQTGAFFPVVSYAAEEDRWRESEVWAAVLQNYMEGRMPLIGRPGSLRFASDDAYDQALEDIFHGRAAVQSALAAVQEIAETDLANPELLEILNGNRQ